MYSIERAYIHTLLRTKTSNSAVQEYFTRSDDDEGKVAIFTAKKYKWRKEFGLEVKIWLKANIKTWLEGGPEWFNAHAMSIIPENFIDDTAIFAQIRSRNVQAIIQERRGEGARGARSEATSKGSERSEVPNAALYDTLTPPYSSLRSSQGRCPSKENEGQVSLGEKLLQKLVQERYTKTGGAQMRDKPRFKIDLFFAQSQLLFLACSQLINYPCLFRQPQVSFAGY